MIIFRTPPARSRRRPPGAPGARAPSRRRACGASPDASLRAPVPWRILGGWNFCTPSQPSSNAPWLQWQLFVSCKLRSLNPGIFAVAPEHDWIKAIPYVACWTPEVTISIFWLDQSTWHARLSHHGNLVSMYGSCSENWGHSMWFLKPACFVFVALFTGPHFSPAMVLLVTSKKGLSLRGRAIGRLRFILNHLDLLKRALQIYYRNLQQIHHSYPLLVN